MAGLIHDDHDESLEESRSIFNNIDHLILDNHVLHHPVPQTVTVTQTDSRNALITAPPAPLELRQNNPQDCANLIAASVDRATVEISRTIIRLNATFSQQLQQASISASNGIKSAQDSATSTINVVVTSASSATSSALSSLTLANLAVTSVNIALTSAQSSASTALDAANSSVSSATVALSSAQATLTSVNLVLTSVASASSSVSSASVSDVSTLSASLSALQASLISIQASASGAIAAAQAALASATGSAAAQASSILASAASATQNAPTFASQTSINPPSAAPPIVQTPPTIFLTPAEIAGIIVGAVVGSLLLIFVLYLLIMKMEKRRERDSYLDEKNSGSPRNVPSRLSSTFRTGNAMTIKFNPPKPSDTAPPLRSVIRRSEDDIAPVVQLTQQVPAVPRIRGLGDVQLEANTSTWSLESRTTDDLDDPFKDTTLALDSQSWPFVEREVESEQSAFPGPVSGSQFNFFHYELGVASPLAKTFITEIRQQDSSQVEDPFEYPVEATQDETVMNIPAAEGISSGSDDRYGVVEEMTESTFRFLDETSLIPMQTSPTSPLPQRLDSEMTMVDNTRPFQRQMSINGEENTISTPQTLQTAPVDEISDQIMAVPSDPMTQQPTTQESRQQIDASFLEELLPQQSSRVPAADTLALLREEVEPRNSTMPEIDDLLRKVAQQNDMIDKPLFWTDFRAAEPEEEIESPGYPGISPVKMLSPFRDEVIRPIRTVGKVEERYRANEARQEDTIEAPLLQDVAEPVFLPEEDRPISVLSEIATLTQAEADSFKALISAVEQISEPEIPEPATALVEESVVTIREELPQFVSPVMPSPITPTTTEQEVQPQSPASVKSISIALQDPLPALPSQMPPSPIQPVAVEQQAPEMPRKASLAIPESDPDDRGLSPLRRNPQLRNIDSLIAKNQTAHSSNDAKPSEVEDEPELDERQLRGRSMIRTSDIIEARLSARMSRYEADEVPKEETTDPLPSEAQDTRNRTLSPLRLNPVDLASIPTPQQIRDKTLSPLRRNPSNPSSRELSPLQRNPSNPSPFLRQASPLRRNPSAPPLLLRSLPKPTTSSPLSRSDSPLRRNPPSIITPSLPFISSISLAPKPTTTIPARAESVPRLGEVRVSSTFRENLSIFQTLAASGGQGDGERRGASREVQQRAMRGIYIPGSLREKAVRGISVSRDRGGGRDGGRDSR